MDEMTLGSQPHSPIEVPQPEDLAIRAIPAARRLVSLASAETQGLGALQERAEALIKDKVRPTPWQVAELVKAGLTSDVILAAGQAAGFVPPHMMGTLREVPVIVDYIQQASDVLAQDPKPKIFAARDAEYMYDDYALRYPNHPAVLLNASGPLFSNINKTLRGDPNPDLPRDRIERFLAAHGLTDEELHRQPRTIVDSGFHGTIGSDLSNTIEKLNGIQPDYDAMPTYLKNGLLTVKLLSAHRPGPIGPALGTEILDSSAFPEAVRTGEAFPKTLAHMSRSPELIRQGMDPRYPFARSTPSAALATALQLLPHHTPHYGHLIEGGESTSPMAVTRDTVRPDENVDVGYYPGANVSIYNPVAALVVQAEVVRRALETMPPTS